MVLEVSVFSVGSLIYVAWLYRKGSSNLLTKTNFGRWKLLRLATGLALDKVDVGMIDGNA
jgi:hypothetical protein